MLPLPFSFSPILSHFPLPVNRGTGKACPAPIPSSLFPEICPVSLPGGNRGAAQSPPCQRGVPRLAEAGGFPQAKPGNFLPITYSLFTKKLSLFHIGWYFEEVPTVNPSVKNQRFLPAPFSKGAFLRPVSLLRCSRCLGQSPPCQRGVPRHRRGGGIPQAGRFPHRLVLSESACCESLSRLRRQLPLAREPFCVRYRYCGAVGA